MTAWRKVEDGKVCRIIETGGDAAPGPGFEKIPADYDYVVGTPLAWINEKGYRIPDDLLVKNGVRKDFTGKWFNTENPGEEKNIFQLDEEPGNKWTKKQPIKDEPFQKWDKGKWVVDTEKKEAEEKEKRLAEKQRGIEELEQRIQRSMRAKIAGLATKEDEAMFTSLFSKIEQLRNEK